MCDNDSLDDMLAFQPRSEFSRRQFGAMAASAGLLLSLPELGEAADVKESEVEIKTADGTADAYFAHPSSGQHPGVLMWPDIIGLRPAFRQMGRRLATSGYSVLVINPFYRTKRAPVAAEGARMDDPAVRSALMALAGSLNASTAATDARGFSAYLDAHASVDKKRKLASVGYCLGGPLTLRTAAALPDRIGAAAVFHGANMVTDKPDSPHLLVPRMKAQSLLAIAENDDQRQPEAKDKLREAFAQAGLPAEIEVYAGAMHGWCPPDGRVYNESQAEKAWARMLALFEKALA
jgi:carboxymethylenebutenolidase